MQIEEITIDDVIELLKEFKTIYIGVCECGTFILFLEQTAICACGRVNRLTKCSSADSVMGVFRGIEWTETTPRSQLLS